MALLDNYLTVNEATAYLTLNGVTWTPGWVRLQICYGRIKSVKIKNSRLVPREELSRIIKEKKKSTVCVLLKK